MTILFIDFKEGRREGGRKGERGDGRSGEGEREREKEK